MCRKSDIQLSDDWKLKHKKVQQLIMGNKVWNMSGFTCSVFLVLWETEKITRQVTQYVCIEMEENRIDADWSGKTL